MCRTSCAPRWRRCACGLTYSRRTASPPRPWSSPGAQEEIARLSRLVNGLLAVARAENIATAQVNLALDVVISTRVAAWQPAADERDVRLEADVERVIARMGDGHLEQILDNLIANALDVLPGGGAIWITAAAVGERARIIVADNGPGHERAAAKARIPPICDQQWRRHRPWPRDRRPAHGRQRRHGCAVGHPWRWSDRDNRPAAGPAGAQPSAGESTCPQAPQRHRIRLVSSAGSAAESAARNRLLGWTYRPTDHD